MLQEITFCIQWNLNRFYNNLANLELLTVESQHCGLWSLWSGRVEMARINQSPGGRGRYTWTVKIGLNIRHSVAIGVHQAMPFNVIDLDSNLTVVDVCLKGKIKISLINAYLPGGSLPNVGG